MLFILIHGGTQLLKIKLEVIKLISKDTIEEKILLLQEDKKELIESLMDEKEMDGKKFKRLSEDEILNLLG